MLQQSCRLVQPIALSRWFFQLWGFPVTTLLLQAIAACIYFNTLHVKRELNLYNTASIILCIKLLQHSSVKTFTSLNKSHYVVNIMLTFMLTGKKS